MYLIGADEVGRGSLAGDVYVCAVMLPDDMSSIHGVRDSKQLSAAGRQRMYDVLTQTPDIYWRIATRTATRINEVGINPATREAYEEAINGLLQLNEPVAEIRVDGNPAWKTDFFSEATTKFIPHGDDTEWIIGAASILAKVSRDAYMKDLASQYPEEYGFKDNVGYGTKGHLAAIKKLGLTDIHRTRFCRKVLKSKESLGSSLIEEMFGA
jgi:ribonuclease HII